MKKLISLLAVSILSVVTAVAASAAPNVSVDKVTAKAGDTVDVNVTLTDCGAWSNIALQFDYSDGLTLVSAATDKITGPMYAGTITTAKPGSMSWSAASPLAYNGTVTTLTFKVADDAAPGAYDITVTYQQQGPDGKAWVDGVNCNFNSVFSYTTFQMEKTPLGLTYTNGSITVESDGPTEPTLAAEKTADGVAITAASPEAITGKFIVAGYNADGLVDVEVIDAAATATSTVTGTKVKVMWWDSLTGLNSIAPAVEL